MSKKRNVDFWERFLDVFKSDDEKKEEHLLSEETKRLARIHEQFNLHLNGNLSINLDNAEARRRLVNEMKKFDGFQVGGRN